MTNSQLASASLMVRYFGSNTKRTSSQSASNLRLLGARIPALALKNLQPSGVAYLRDNAKTAKAAAAEISLNEAQTSPWFATAVDQEGGAINRLSGDIEPPLAAFRIGAVNKTWVAKTVAEKSAKQLRAAKIKVVFAPVADVKSSVSSTSMSQRMLGSDAAKVSVLIKAQLQGYGQQGVLATVKHFPGLGGVKADTHKSIAQYAFTKQRLCSVDLAPFRAAVSGGAPSIMVGHGIYSGFGGDPASGNEVLVTQLLRQEMGFNGIIITDSMTMKGAQANLDPNENLYRRALQAGVDVILMPGNPVLVKRLIAKDLQSGTISIEDRRESIARVIAWQLARERVAQSSPIYPPGSPELQRAAKVFQSTFN
jgi:beta-N-acetylhexosaminidase